MKTILITGSTDGIGKLAAIKLAKDGNKVYLHGRSSAKLEKVIHEVKEASNNQNIEGFVADFSDMQAVQTMVNQVESELTQLDVLINNAGIFKTGVTETKDGFDIRMAVNYFAPYLLTNGVLSLLQKSESPRVINLSSAAQATVDLHAMAGNQPMGMQEAYAQSKLAILMWSFDFAKTHQDILTIALNPGSLLNTKMVQEAYGRHWSSADKGANIIYDLAVSEEYTLADSGTYFDNDQGDPKGAFNQAHPDAYDESKITELMNKTKETMQQE